MTRLTWAEVTHLFGLLFRSCQWHNISPCHCNSTDRTAETPRCSPPIKIRHRSHTDNKNRTILNVSRVGSLLFPHGGFFCYGAQKKNDRDFIQCAFLIYFCRKIGLFTCKSNVFVKEYEKNLCQGIPEWHSKKYTFYKSHKKKTHAQKHECMYESEFVLVIQVGLHRHCFTETDEGGHCGIPDEKTHKTLHLIQLVLILRLC